MDAKTQAHLDEASSYVRSLRYLFGQKEDEVVELTYHELFVLLKPIDRNLKAALKAAEA